MKKRDWNRKVSALLMAGLVLSALPVHAFAEEEQKSVDVAAQAVQEADEPMNVPVEGDDNAGGTQDGAVPAEGTSELKGTEVDTENQGDAGKEAEEELAEESLQPEELTLASASDIPMTDTAAETESSLLGTWTVDGYTSLAFYGDGKGAMLLPTESYDFHYTLNDDQLDLDFVSSRARDLSYTISLDADTLQLSSGTGTNTVAITLQRVK